MPSSKITPHKGHVVPGVVVNDNQFVAAIPGVQLFQIVVDPRLTENLRLVAEDPALAAVREVRNEVQRVFDGAKKKNVPDYAAYINQVHVGQPGVTPAIILWSKEPLPYEEMEDGCARLQIPYEVQIVAIDGETQLAARFEASKTQPPTKGDKVAVMFCHGRDAAWARQAFHDVNTFGVRPNSALAIGMDARDPLTTVTREIGTTVAFFKNRVNTSRRQLGKADTDVVTISALRTACVTLAEGISGVKHGAKRVPLSDAVVPQIRVVALEWFKALTALLGPAMEDRENKVAGSPPVLAALGAMGHQLLDISDADARKRRIEELIESLHAVRWEKGEHWAGIAGKTATSGTFSVGGTKEVVYQVYGALADPTDPSYDKVRKLLSVEPVPVAEAEPVPVSVAS